MWGRTAPVSVIGAQVGLGMASTGNGSVRMSGNIWRVRKMRRRGVSRKVGKGRNPFGLLQVVHSQLGLRRGWMNVRVGDTVIRLS